MKRFWDKVNKTKTCWLWTGGKNSGGYGQIKVNGKAVKAHRFIFTLVGTPMPDNLQALHRCDNTSCVKPEHLFWGTHNDNMKDMKMKGRAKGHKGEANFNHKLTQHQVLEIRGKYKDRKTPTARIAKLYGVSQPMISYILIGKSWRGNF